jgi:hypothetical protein
MVEQSRESLRISYATLILVAALVLIGIGIQSILSQHASAEHDTCVNDWGADLIKTSSTRSAAQEKYEAAATNRDDALDSLLVAAIGIQNVPEAKKQAALADLIADYVKSVDRKRRATVNLSETREKNPLPRLRC